MSTERPQPSAVPPALIERLKHAIEGECEGLAVDDAHAAAILAHVLDGSLPVLAQPLPLKGCHLEGGYVVCTPSGRGIEGAKELRRAIEAQARQALSAPTWELAPQAGAVPLSDDDILRIADTDQCNPDKSGWGPKFDYLLFARAVLAAATASATAPTNGRAGEGGPAAARTYTYDEIIRYGRICFWRARATTGNLEPMPAVDLIDDPAALSDALAVAATSDDGRMLDKVSRALRLAIRQLEAHRPVDSPSAAKAAKALRAHLEALSSPQAAPLPAAALRDIAAERKRQVDVEGWDAAHDDEHDAGQLSSAAAAYALGAADLLSPLSQGDSQWIAGNPPDMWPWESSWWKPGDPRRMLVKAGALILAELERLDRAALSRLPAGGPTC